MLKRILLVLFISATALPSFSEDGSRLWLRYDTVSVRKQIDKGIDSPVMRLAENELSTFWKEGKVSLQLMADSEYFALGKDGYTIYVENGTTVLRSMSETGLLMLPIIFSVFRHVVKTAPDWISRRSL